jgi:hypothetical protein
MAARVCASGRPGFAGTGLVRAAPAFAVSNGGLRRQQAQRPLSANQFRAMNESSRNSSSVADTDPMPSSNPNPFEVRPFNHTDFTDLPECARVRCALDDLVDAASTARR